MTVLMPVMQEFLLEFGLEQLIAFDHHLVTSRQSADDPAAILIHGARFDFTSDERIVVLDKDNPLIAFVQHGLVWNNQRLTIILQHDRHVGEHARPEPDMLLPIERFYAVFGVCYRGSGHKEK